MQNSIIESKSGGGTRRGTSFSPDRKANLQLSNIYENLGPGETLNVPMPN